MLHPAQHGLGGRQQHCAYEPVVQIVGDRAQAVGAPAVTINWHVHLPARAGTHHCAQHRSSMHVALLTTVIHGVEHRGIHADPPANGLSHIMTTPYHLNPMWHSAPWHPQSAGHVQHDECALRPFACSEFLLSDVTESCCLSTATDMGVCTHTGLLNLCDEVLASQSNFDGKGAITLWVRRTFCQTVYVYYVHTHTSAAVIMHACTPRA